MTINKSVAVAIATGSLLLNAFATTAFADTVTVTGNGADSSNTVTTTNNSTTTVQQSNTASISNDVHSSANTGGNDANYNTGGSVSVGTGNATTNTQVVNAANLNQANVSCGCTNNGTDVTVSGNGADSHNNVTSSNGESGTQLVQTNNADITNSIGSEAKTGGNDANYNTGGTNGMGTVTVQTGSASTTTGVSTMANANVATIGGGAGTGTGASAVISGNGADSHNYVTLNNNSATLVWQTNNADVSNDVWSGAFTGKNDANYNTGGDVTVETGSAHSTVGVDNKVNFNAASVDCGCFMTGDLLKIAGNGADTHNKIIDNNGGGLSVLQGGGENGNVALLSNDVNGNSGTGKNDSNDNTGAVLGDPTTVMTGSSTSLTGVSNTGNVNLFGNGVTLPEFNLGFDMSGLFGMFGM